MAAFRLGAGVAAFRQGAGEEAVGGVTVEEEEVELQAALEAVSSL